MTTPETSSRAGEDLSPTYEIKTAVTGFLSEFRGFADDVHNRLQQQDQQMTRLSAKMTHMTQRPMLAADADHGAPHRKAPLWNRRRVMDTATRLLYTDRVSVEGLLTSTFPFDHAPEAFAWLDQHPQSRSSTGRRPS